MQRSFLGFPAFYSVPAFLFYLSFPIMQNHHGHLQNRKGLHTKVRRPSCLVFYYGPYYTQEIHRLQVFFDTPFGVRVQWRRSRQGFCPLGKGLWPPFGGRLCRGGDGPLGPRVVVSPLRGDEYISGQRTATFSCPTITLVHQLTSSPAHQPTSPL